MYHDYPSCPGRMLMLENQLHLVYFHRANRYTTGLDGLTVQNENLGMRKRVSSEMALFPFLCSIHSSMLSICLVSDVAALTISYSDCRSLFLLSLLSVSIHSILVVYSIFQQLNLINIISEDSIGHWFSHLVHLPALASYLCIKLFVSNSVDVTLPTDLPLKP
jgi:hypothetical protein